MRALLFLAVLGFALWLLARELAAEGKRIARRREAEAAARARELAAEAELGGTPGDPILVPTASVVEAEAVMRRCPRCDVPLRLVEHVAETVGQDRLRVVRLTCPVCATPRSLYFRIGLPV